MSEASQLIPDANTPGAYIAVNRNTIGAQSGGPRALVIGPKITGAALVENEQVAAPSVAEAVALAGDGSPIAVMVAEVLKNFSRCETWIATLGDANAAAASARTFNFVGSLTADGTWSLGAGGRLYQVDCASGTSPTDQATAVKNAINDDDSREVNATSTGAALTLTARFKGKTGDEIAVVLNPGGARAGQAVPAGGSITELASTPYTTLGSGGSVPAMTDLIKGMADDEYDVVVCAYNDTTNIDALNAEVCRRRWEPAVAAPFGVVIYAKRDSATNLNDFGDAIGQYRALCAGVEPANHASPWAWAAAWGARIADALIFPQPGTGVPRAAHRGLTGVPLVGLPATLPRYRFSQAQKELLVTHGIATHYTDQAGTVYIESEVSTQGGVMMQEAAKDMGWARYLRTGLFKKFKNLALVDDDVDTVPDGCAAPKSYRAECLSLARDVLKWGWMRNFSEFVENLKVGLNAAGDRMEIDQKVRWSKVTRQIKVAVQPLG